MNSTLSMLLYSLLCMFNSQGKKVLSIMEDRLPRSDLVIGYAGILVKKEIIIRSGLQAHEMVISHNLCGSGNRIASIFRRPA